MIIAVNTRFLLAEHMEGYGYFHYEVLRRLAVANPEHTFLFIFDRRFDEKFVFSQNVRPVIAGPPARHPILWKWWYDVKVPRLLKKWRADVFLSCDGFCSLRTKLPQCLVIHDLSFLHFPECMRRDHQFYYKKYTPHFVRKATTIATVSNISKNDIIANYKINSEKIDVVYSAVKDIFQPVSLEVQENTRRKHTNGKNYFLYVGAIHPRKNLVRLLKAFSIFKKRQKSEWKLVLAGRLAWQYNTFLQDMKTYKYRDDVVLTGYLPEKELVNVIGSAYTLIYPSVWEGFGVPVVEAMKCRVPVITSEQSSMQEIAGDAALYVNPSDHEDIADKMMRLYKDETLRDMLIEKGEVVARQYNWDKTAALIWSSLMKAANVKTGDHQS
jgi:glycosyltransferase involved in cell wall biosynthesis